MDQQFETIINALAKRIEYLETQVIYENMLKCAAERELMDIRNKLGKACQCGCEK